jgi:Tfp pilus assembly ATPase PilU
MVMNARIADLIREGRAEEISGAIAEGDFFEMQTFTQALIEHVLSGKVDPDVAANAATNRHDFLVSLEHALKHKDAVAREAVEAEAAKDEPELRVVGLDA